MCVVYMNNKLFSTDNGKTPNRPRLYWWYARVWYLAYYGAKYTTHTDIDMVTTTTERCRNFFM